MSSHGSEHASGQDVSARDATETGPLHEDPAPTEVGPTGAAPVSSEVEQPAAAPTERRTRERNKGPLGFLRELPILLLVAFVLALLIKTFLIQAFYIPSASMEPTLQIGDRVLVNKVVYHLHPPRVGDVIVFSDPHPEPAPHRNSVSGFFHWLTEGLGVSSSPEKDFIKRVIAVPGDTVELDDHGTVLLNGRALKEPYISPIRDTRPYGPTKVPAHELFVLGDNRTNSNDSRFGLGFIPYDKVVGRAFVVIWPPSRIRWLHGQ
jgi:signal peptidase I